MGAPKYRAPIPKKQKPTPKVSKVEVEEIRQKILEQLKSPEKVKKISTLIEKLIS